MKNYSCSKCTTIIQSERLPHQTGCTSGGQHSWTELGLVGVDTYQCKKCGCLVKSARLPYQSVCTGGSRHNWSLVSSGVKQKSPRQVNETNQPIREKIEPIKQEDNRSKPKSKNEDHSSSSSKSGAVDWDKSLLGASVNLIGKGIKFGADKAAEYNSDEAKRIRELKKELKEEDRQQAILKEQKEADNRKAKAEKLRSEGKNLIAFFVGLNPTYSIATVLVIAVAGMYIFKKVNKTHSNTHATEYTTSPNSNSNEIQTNSQEQSTTLDNNELKDNVTNQTPAESNELTPQKMVGLWKGEFGKNELTLNIESVDENGNVRGYNEVKGNRRVLTGKCDDKDNGYILQLNEPGDEEWDGVFEFTYSNSTNEISGQWKSNNGKSTKPFLLTKK